MPPRLREPFRLHYYQEKSDREIALELGITYENVRKRMSQARAILREKLSGFVGEEGTGEMPVLGQREFNGTGGTPVLRLEVGASVWDGHLGQKQPDAGVREMRWLFGLCWRLWGDSGGCWLSSI